MYSNESAPGAQTQSPGLLEPDNIDLTKRWQPGQDIPSPPGVLTDDEAVAIRANWPAVPPADRPFFQAHLAQYDAFRVSAPRMVDLKRQADQIRTLEDLTLDFERTTLGNGISPKSLELAPDNETAQKAKEALTVDTFVRQRTGQHYTGALRHKMRDAVAVELFGEGKGLGSDTEFVNEARTWATKRRDERTLLSGPEHYFSGEEASADAARQSSLFSLLSAAAMRGEPFASAYGAWQLQAKGKPGFDPARMADYETTGREYYRQFDAGMMRAQPVAEKILAGLQQEQAEAGAYGGDKLIDDVLSVPRELRPMVYTLLAGMAEKEGAKKEAGGQFTQAFARGSANLLVGTARTMEASALDDAEKKLVAMKPGDKFGGRFPDLWSYLRGQSAPGMEQQALKFLAEPFLTNKTVTKEDLDAAKSQIATQRERLAVGMDLEQVGKSILDPIKGKNWLQKAVIYPFAESVLPTMALFAATRTISAPAAGSGLLSAAINLTRGAGAMVPMYGMMADQNAQQLMQQNPGMPVQQAFKLGREASYVQTGLEYLQQLIAFGGFKSLGAALRTSQASFWRTLGKQAVLQTVEQNALEGLQDITPQIVQGLQKDMPMVDWQQVFHGKEIKPDVTVRTEGTGDTAKNLWSVDGQRFDTQQAADAYAKAHTKNDGSGYWSQRADTFWALLPAVIFGSGHHAMNVKAMRPQLEAVATNMDDVSLNAAGIPAPQRAAILAHTDAVERLDAFSAALPNADKATAEEGAIRIQKQREAASGVFSAEMQKAGVTLERSNIDGHPVFRVTAPGGAVTEHATVADALETVNSHLDAEFVKTNKPALDMLAALEARTQSPTAASRTAIMAQQSSAADALLAAEEGGDTALADAMKNRMAVEQARTPDAPINWQKMSFEGQSELEVKEGILTAVSRIHAGASALVPLEERAESDVEAWVKGGETNWENLAGLIREVETATGDTWLSGHTAGQNTAQDQMAVKEAYSALTLAYATARGRGNAVGAVARGERAGAQQRLQDAKRKGVAAPLLARLEAAWQWFRQVMLQSARLNKARREGKLGDIETFLQRSVGIEPAVAHALGVEAVAREVFGSDAVGTRNQPAAQAEGTTAEAAQDAKPPGPNDISFAVAPIDLQTYFNFNETEAQEVSDAAREGADIQSGPEIQDPAQRQRRGLSDLQKKALAIMTAAGRNREIAGDWVADRREGILNDWGKSKAGRKWLEQRLTHTEDLLRDGRIQARDLTGTGEGARYAEGRTPEAAEFYEQQMSPLRDMLKFRPADTLTGETLAEIEQFARDAIHHESSAISFRVSPTKTLDAVSEALGTRMARDPDARRKLTEKAQEALARLKREWSERRFTWMQDEIRPLVDKRTAKELNREQAFRQAQAFDRALESRGLAPAESERSKDSKDYETWQRFQESRALLLEKGFDEAQAERLARASSAKWRADHVAAVKQALADAKADAETWRAEQEAVQEKDWSPKAVLVRNLRILDAVLSVFPPDVRAKVGGWIPLARLSTDAAMAKEIDRRITKLDEELESSLKKSYLDEIAALQEAAEPKREGGKKPTGKLGFEAHRFFDTVKTVGAMTETEVETRRAEINAEMARLEAAKELTPELAADLFEQEQVLDTFGNLAGKNAAHLARALDLLQDVYDNGRNRWRTQEEARLEEVRGLVADTVKALGGVSRAAIQQQKVKADKALSLLKSGQWSIKSFTETMELLFGRNHVLALRWSNAVREGFAQRTTEIVGLMHRWKAAMNRATGLKGRKARHAVWEMSHNQTISANLQPTTTTTERVPVEALGKILAGEADAKSLGLSGADIAELQAQFEALPEGSEKNFLTLTRVHHGTAETAMHTEAEAIFLSMLHAQEQYREAMAEAGYTDETIAGIEEQITPAGKELQAFLSTEYRDGYEPLAKVFRRMFGVDLPQIENYAPGAFYHTGGTQQSADPFGPIIPDGGFRAGFLKDRKPHKAAPDAQSAFSVFFGHANQAAHWKALAEVTRELRGVFGNPDVKQAIDGKHGREASQKVSEWMTAIEGNGIQTASSKLARAIFTMQAHVALAWKVGTIMKQSTALLGAWYRMPASDYLRGLGRLMAGKLNPAEMWKSDMIQRRVVAGFTPEVRAVMANAWNTEPTWRNAFMEKGMEFIGLTDAFFTCGSAAICWDYHYRNAIKAGNSESEARSIAESEAADMVARTAQPVEVADRSLMELNMSGVGRAMFMFGSEARQKSSLWLTAWAHTLTGKPTKEDFRVLLIAHMVMGPMLQAIVSAWRDARDDDDDSLFDLTHWNPTDFLTAPITTPLGGLPYIRDMVDYFHGESGPLSRFGVAFDPGIGRKGAMWQLFDGPKDYEPEQVEWYARRVFQVMQGLGTFTAVAGGIAEQGFRVTDNMFDTETERGVKQLRKEEKAHEAAVDAATSDEQKAAKKAAHAQERAAKIKDAAVRSQ